ncbi:ABC transporter permease [Bradyrhizobium sp. NAS80.1]|uniref:branched-chain amino acid ABC transporter permease n=1 Tax=Bradyrhizobium sp. NAS80.1 TaxID=1680159 RepID=UPI00095D0C46|nr:branched-chain amino acid ABC transporter permease [Bradyrhizobium sp. NAS80.1]OKO86278.1 ABC transporter permease [Bradyrhizobium sp. NAS80.1]
MRSVFVGAIRRGAPAVIIAAVAVPPILIDGYALSVAINVAQYGVMATAWAMFSGPTRYVSLATVAFYGVGVYTAALLGGSMPWAIVLLAAALSGATLAILAGMLTLRLSGVYFVIFTFSLSELLRQIVTWYEVNVHRSVGRYVFLDVAPAHIYSQLLGLLALLLALAWLLRRSRMGLALRIIGADLVVANHIGIDTAKVRVLLFAFSAIFMSTAGAIIAPRWTYVDPAIAFSQTISFEVLIMALFGGVQLLFGPLIGVASLCLVFEYLSIQFPDQLIAFLGLIYLLIVYVMPSGIVPACSAVGQVLALREKAVA